MGCTVFSSEIGAEKSGDFLEKTLNFRKKALICGRKKGATYTELYDVSRLHGKVYVFFQFSVRTPPFCPAGAANHPKFSPQPRRLDFNELSNSTANYERQRRKRNHGSLRTKSRTREHMVLTLDFSGERERPSFPREKMVARIRCTGLTVR